MNVRIRHSIVIRKQVDVCVRRTAKASIAINVCRIHMDGNTRKDVNYVIAITSVRLDNRAIYLRDSVCVVKGSPVVSAIDVRLAILDIRIVNAATAIATDH